jgi:hypothetical protein
MSARPLDIGRPAASPRRPAQSSKTPSGLPFIQDKASVNQVRLYAALADRASRAVGTETHMLSRLDTFTGIALLLGLVGTAAQALLSLRALSEQDASFRSALAIYDLKREVHWWHPVRFVSHRREVRRALSGSPDEAAAYKRLRTALVSWALLATGALMALIGVATGR